MKFFVYRFDTREKGSRQKQGLNIERFLFMAFIAIFALLIVVQAALTSPSIRASLSINDELEGVPLGVEEFLYDQGTLTLQLLTEESNESLRILVNGDAVQTFSQNKIELPVKDGDVVEIDGSELVYEAEVAIVGKSENIVTDCLSTSITTESDVKELVKVKID